MLHFLTNGNPATFPSMMENKLEFVDWNSWKEVELIKVDTCVRMSVVDKEGIGKGKERFYEKFGFVHSGVMSGIARKWGRGLDADVWVLNFGSKEEKGEGKVMV